jgi:hypothetical protein
LAAWFDLPIPPEPLPEEGKAKLREIVERAEMREKLATLG